MYCQACGTFNEEGEEFCYRCHQRLLVLSGNVERGDGFATPDGDDGFSLDEHLLERISILEEAVKRMAETVRLALTSANTQERSILVNQSGLAALRELLESKQLVEGEEWSRLWKSKMDYRLQALERRQRFLELKGRILALFSGSRRELFRQLLDDAEYALFSFDIGRAVDALETAYRLDRDNYELGYFIGEIYFNGGDTKRALPYFERVLRVAPEHYEGLVYSGVIYHELGDAGRAESLLKRAVSLHPESFLPNFSLGAIYAAQSRLAKAVTLLAKAVQIEPVVEAVFLLGNSLYEMGKTTQAIQHLESVVRQDPAHEDAHYLLGLAYLDRGWNRKALDAFRQAQELNPKKLRYQDFVHYLSGQGDSLLPEIEGEAQRWARQAEESLREEDGDRAVDHYRRALEADPDHPTLLISCAIACLGVQRPQETEALTRRLLELEPNEMLKATASATLIEALRAEGRLREGNRLGKQLLEEAGTPYARTIAYYELAYNLAEMEEDLDDALAFARESLQHSPEELKQFPLAALGWVHYKREEFEQAVEFLTRATELDPSATSLTHLGMAMLASGKDGDAKSVLARAREAEGKNASVQQRMMECMRDSRRLLERARVRDRKARS